MESFSGTTNQWSAPRKFLFRFVLVYFALYCIPFPLDGFDFTKPIAKPFYDFWDWLIPIVGRVWFHIRVRTAFPMFDKMDDSGYGLVFIYFNLILSCVGAIAWTLLDRQRPNYEKLYQWLRVYLRYYLAGFLFGYGFIKVFPSQFQPITASWLTMPVGEQSAMLLAWHFMGYSTVMMRLNGLAEVLAGVLLLFRRTTTLGAILSTAVFSYVVVMDFCFNVPVRLLASHLLIISFYLILQDRQKLLNLFLLNKSTQPTVFPALIAHAGMRKAFLFLQAFIGISLLYSTLSHSLEEEKTYGHKAKPVPLYGIYRTVYFIRNRDTLPALETDSFRWKQLIIDGRGWMKTGIIQYNNDKRSSYTINTDTTKRILQIELAADSTKKYSINYTSLKNNQLLLQGRLNQDSIEILMTKYDLDNYPLHKEKFTWISE